MTSHVIKLHGAAASEARVSGPVLADLLSVLVDGSRRALRLRLEGRSTAKGTAPGWVKTGAGFEVLSSDSAATLTLEAPTLLEAIPERVQQADFFTEVDPTRSALDLLEDALEDAVRGNTDSDRFDYPLVERMSALGSLFDEGIEGIEWINGHTVTVEPADLVRVKAMQRQTPPPQAVRVVGRVDVMRASDMMFTLHLGEGGKVRGIAGDMSRERLAQYFGKPAVVTGMAVFRPSGSLLRVEAEHLYDPSPADVALFSAMPEPLLSPLPRERRSPTRGILALRGRWPGDETDDEIARTLRELG